MRSVLVLVAGVMAVANAASAETQLERGAYLVDVVGACDNCHTPRPNRITDFSKRLSGGTLVFNEVWFTARATNITPDPATRNGKWSGDALKAAIVKGVRPNGTSVAPFMPFNFYAVMSAGDQDAMVAYLRTIINEVPPPTYKTEFYKLEYLDAARITEEEMKTPSDAAPTSRCSCIAWPATHGVPRNSRPISRARGARAGARSRRRPVR